MVSLTKELILHQKIKYFRTFALQKENIEVWKNILKER